MYDISRNFEKDRSPKSIKTEPLCFFFDIFLEFFSFLDVCKGEVSIHNSTHIIHSRGLCFLIIFKTAHSI